MHDDIAALPIGRRIASYEIRSLLGVGGMGEVYRARDLRLERDVAIKVLPASFAADPERLRRFEQEARVLATLNHPHIATIHGFEDADGVRALVLELVEGQTLAERLAAGALPLQEALTIAAQIAEALEAAHEKGIVHRDLKPANIKLSRDGSVKVLDFGLAKVFGSESADVSRALTLTVTEAGVIAGTPAYMSPEQARGQVVDKRTDIWAFGCVLFEMLTGTQAFGAETGSDTLARVLQTDPAWKNLPGSVPSQVRVILERCVEKDLKVRRRDIGDVRVDLLRALEINPQTMSAGGSAPPKSSRLPVWAAGISALAAIAAGTAFLNRTPPHRDLVGRFSHALPEGQTWPNIGYPLLSVSPDGSSFVYVANGQLHLRPTNALASAPIRGTEGSPVSPLFSPDGRSIAFVDVSPGRPQQLKQVAVTGGAPIVLATISNFFGGNWERDRTIVFAQDDGIWKVRSEGGTPERIVSIEPGEMAQSPQLSADRGSVLFTLTSGVGRDRWEEAARIVVESLGSGERRVVHTEGSSARYLPTGHLVYALRGVLFALPFDGTAFEATGRPTPVVEGIRSGALYPGSMAAANYSVSDTGTLIYAAGEPARVVARSVVSVDRDGKTEPLVDERRDYWRPRVSPDGTRIAVEVGDGRTLHIWILDTASGVAMPLTLDGVTNWAPVWTRDGKSIVYASDRDGFYGIYRKPADGSGAVEQLRRSDQELVPTDSSPDGIVAFVEGGDTTDKTIWTLRLDNLEAKELLATPAIEQMAMFSPDGRWLAYVSDESGQFEVYVRPYPNVEGGVRRVSTGGGIGPVWSSDGTALFFRSRAGMLVRVPVRVGAEPTFGRPQTLFQFSGRFRVSGQTSAYDVAQRSDRFIMVTEEESPAPAPRQINIVTNWLEELRTLGGAP